MKPEYIKMIIKLALAEDIGAGDITTNSLVPPGSRSKARLVAHADGIICGMAIAAQVFKTLNHTVVFRPKVKDGQSVLKGKVLAEISGPTRSLLAAERVSLNFLTLLSGIATQTRRYVDAVKPCKAKIMDTRKTTPLLRRMERYAVRTGGGVNHRFNLNDMVLIKDNHRPFCGNGTLQHLKRRAKSKIEVEVDDLGQLQQLLPAGVDIILLDNMTPQQVAQAVRLRDRAKAGALLEASGGITLANVRQYAKTGVDRISIGALTHEHKALDISMDLKHE